MSDAKEIVVEPGRSASRYLQELQELLVATDPKLRRSTAWKWQRAAMDIGMTTEVARRFRVLAMGICEDGLP